MATSQQDPHDQHFARNVASAASTVKNAFSAAAKAGSGNIAGAVLDVLKDENMRKGVIACISIILFLLLGLTMLIGTGITGTVESIQSDLEKNWDQAWEEEGVYSQGNSLYLYSTGWQNAQSKADFQTIADFLTGLFRTDHRVDDMDATNSALSAETAIQSSDYQTMIDSITDEAALLGENGALPRRLEMIKGRVGQRGEQISNLATAQYGLESIGISIAENLAAMVEDPLLYNGVDLEASSISIDTTAFDLTDIQALKVYAAYAIQHDILLSESDMWDLMDYCGWYATEFDSIDTTALADSTEPNIYNSVVGGNFTNNFQGVIESGDAITSSIYQLSAPKVQYWSGSCAPQWYYEQIAQLQALNESYDLAKKKAEATPETDDDEALADLPHFQTDEDGNIVLDNFQNLSSCETFGIIDKIYTGGSASLTVTATEYTCFDAPTDEFLASIGSFLKSFWDEAYGTKTKTTKFDNRVYRTNANEHSYTIYNTVPGRDYYLVNKETGLTTETKTGNGESLSFFGLHPSTTYTVRQTFTIEDKKDPENPITVIAYIETFTTFPSSANTEAYELILDLNVGYTARTIDDLIYSILGLWPGSLSDTQVGEDGVEYATGHVGNQNLRRSWTDTYTDPETGTVTTLTFQRQQAHQAEAYQDIVLALADAMGYSTAGLFTSNYGYGSTMISMAKQELEFYQANNLEGGQRYWGIAGEARFGNPNAYDPTQPWCVAFVNACAYQCGFIGPDGWFAEENWPFWCAGIYSSLLRGNHGTGHDTRDDTYKPVPGDLIFFGDGVGCQLPDHIGIVEYVDSEGRVHTIEGNSNNRVQRCVYDSYLLGTYAWDSGSYNACISHYLNPNYPSTFLEDPTYLSIPGKTAPSLSCKIASGSDTLLGGLPRFRLEAMDEVLDELAIMYPELYTVPLRNAYPYNLGACTADQAVWLLPCRFSSYKQKAEKTGIDLTAQDGTQVFAVRDGVVLESSSNSTMGTYIIIEHNGGYQTNYLYLHTAHVAKGDSVKAGQVIGAVGSSGNSTTPHLHYEILKSGSAVDPKGYLGISNPSSFQKDYRPESFDPSALSTAWNMLILTDKTNRFAEAQMNIAAKIHVQPLAQAVTMATGFNWTATRLREEILWGIATTSSNFPALLSVLKSLSADLENAITDNDLILHLTTDNLLLKTISLYKTSLWPNDPQQLQTAWINSIQLLTEELLRIYSTPAVPAAAA